MRGLFKNFQGFDFLKGFLRRFRGVEVRLEVFKLSFGAPDTVKQISNIFLKTF